MTQRARSDAGFSFLEVMVALALIAIGALVGLSMIMGTSLRNEVSKEQAIAYRACQDVMEALMSMDKATLEAQMTWQVTNAQPGTFTVPALDSAAPPTGTFAITDITTTINASATTTEVVQIEINLNHKKVRVQLTNRRYLP